MTINQTHQMGPPEPTTETEEGNEKLDWPLIIFLGVMATALAAMIVVVVYVHLNSWTVVQRSDGKYTYRSAKMGLHRWNEYDTCEQATEAMNKYRERLRNPPPEEPDAFTYKKVKCD